MTAAVDSFILFALSLLQFYLSNRYGTLFGPRKDAGRKGPYLSSCEGFIEFLIYNDSYCTVAIPWSSLKTFPLPFFHGT